MHGIRLDQCRPVAAVAHWLNKTALCTLTVCSCLHSGETLHCTRRRPGCGDNGPCVD